MASHCITQINAAFRFPLKGNYSLKELCIAAIVENKLSFDSVSNDLQSDIQAFVERDTQNRYSIVKGFLPTLVFISGGDYVILSNSIMVCFFHTFCNFEKTFVTILEHFQDMPKEAPWFDFMEEYFRELGGFLAVGALNVIPTAILSFLNECILCTLVK